MTGVIRFIMGDVLMPGRYEVTAAKGNQDMRCRTGKVRHRTQRAAVITMRKLHNAGLSSYPCPHCKGWHLGNSNKDWKVQARIDQLLGKA